MRYRDRWEQWLRAELNSLPLSHGVDVATAWAVASMLATYANADGSGITVSAETIRTQLRIGKPKLAKTLEWLNDSGVVTITKNHGRGTPTQRALTIPNTEPNGTTLGGPVNQRDEQTTQDGPVNHPTDKQTTQTSPVNTGLNGPGDRLNGPITQFERTSNPPEGPFDRTAQGGPQPEELTKKKPRGGGPHAHARETPTATAELLPMDPGPEPHHRCIKHRGQDTSPACVACGDLRIEHERWEREHARWTERPSQLPPVCGRCDAKPGDAPSARMTTVNGRPAKCLHCHPACVALWRPSTTDLRVAQAQALKDHPKIRAKILAETLALGTGPEQETG